MFLEKWELCPTVFAPAVRRHNKQSPKVRALSAQLVVNMTLKSASPEDLEDLYQRYPELRPES